MADRTPIEWTDATWNPIVGCSVTSPGCTNCYAMRLAGTRLKHHPSRAGLTTDSKAGPVWTGETRFDERALTQPLRWRRPRKIFVCAHSDLFHEATPGEWIDRVFAVMALAPQHAFQVLTKRPGRMREYLTDRQTVTRVQDAEMVLHFAGLITEPDGIKAWPLPNVWLGVTAEDQTRADERIPILLATPAARRFVSVEPMLGAVDLRQVSPNGVQNIDVLAGRSTTPDHSGWPILNWVIVGGESGPGARPMHPDWARALRDQCAAAGVAFMLKQWGEWGLSGQGDRCVSSDGRNLQNLEPGCGRNGDDTVRIERIGKRAAGRLLDGVEHNEFPEGC